MANTLGTEEALRYIALLDDPDPEVRRQALGILGSYYHEPEGFRYDAATIRRATPRAVELLADEHLGVRSESAYLLGWIATDAPQTVREAIPKLVELLDAEDELAREHGAFALEMLVRLQSFANDVREAAPRLVEAISKYPDPGRGLWLPSIGSVLTALAEKFPEDIGSVFPILVGWLDAEAPKKVAEGAEVLALALEKYPAGGVYPDAFQPAAEKLAALLGHQDGEVRKQAAFALEGLARLVPKAASGAAPGLAALLDDKDGYARLRAASALGWLARGLPGDADFARVGAAVIAKLISPPPYKHEELWALSVSGASKFALTEITVNFPEQVKPWVGRVVRSFTRSRAFDSLAAIAKRFPEEVKAELQNPLWQLHPAGGLDENALTGVRKLAPKFPEEVRAAIPEDFDPAVVARAVEQLDSEDWDVKQKALLSIPELGGRFPAEVRPALPKIIKLLDLWHVPGGDYGFYDAGWRDAAKAIGEMARWFPEDVGEAVPRLMRRYRGYHWGAREAIQQLAWRSPACLRGVIPRLVRHLDAKDEILRRDSAEVLALVAGEYPQDVSPAAPGLVRRLGDSRTETRLWAAYALGNLGEASALAPLKSLFEDEDNAVYCDFKPFEDFKPFGGRRKTRSVVEIAAWAVAKIEEAQAAPRE